MVVVSPPPPDNQHGGNHERSHQHIHRRACRNNSGPGGWAAVIVTPHGTNLTVRGKDPTSTNNRMELTAAVKGLQELDHLTSQPRDVPVILHSDSKYLTDAFNQNWLGRGQGLRLSKHFRE